MVHSASANPFGSLGCEPLGLAHSDMDLSYLNHLPPVLLLPVHSPLVCITCSHLPDRAERFLQRHWVPCALWMSSVSLFPSHLIRGQHPSLLTPDGEETFCFTFGSHMSFPAFVIPTLLLRTFHRYLSFKFQLPLGSFLFRSYVCSFDKQTWGFFFLPFQIL